MLTILIILGLLLNPTLADSRKRPLCYQRSKLASRISLHFLQQEVKSLESTFPAILSLYQSSGFGKLSNPDQDLLVTYFACREFCRKEGQKNCPGLPTRLEPYLRPFKKYYTFLNESLKIVEAEFPEIFREVGENFEANEAKFRELYQKGKQTLMAELVKVWGNVASEWAEFYPAGDKVFQKIKDLGSKIMMKASELKSEL